MSEAGRDRVDPANPQVLLDRTHRFDAPASVLFGALSTAPMPWMRLAPGEVIPRIVEAVPSTRVVWSSFWPVNPDDTVRLDLVGDAPEVTNIRLRWFTANPPDERGIGITRQRLNRKIGGDLRSVVSTYYWTFISPRSWPTDTT